MKNKYVQYLELIFKAEKSWLWASRIVKRGISITKVLVTMMVVELKGLGYTEFELRSKKGDLIQ